MSKGLISFIVVAMLFFAGLYIGSNAKDLDLLNTKDNKEIYKRLNSIQSELDKYKAKDTQEKVRELELKALQDPQIIIDQLHKVGKLIVYEGKASYEDIIIEKTFWTSRQLTIDLKYNFGVSMDLTNVNVISIAEKSVILDIPNNKLTLEYLELNPELSRVQSKKSLFAFHFMPEDVKYIFQNAYTITKNRIKATKGIQDVAYECLKENLTNIIHRLGYSEVKFQEN